MGRGTNANTHSPAQKKRVRMGLVVILGLVFVLMAFVSVVAIALSRKTASAAPVVVMYATPSPAVPVAQVIAPAATSIPQAATALPPVEIASAPTSAPVEVAALPAQPEPAPAQEPSPYIQAAKYWTSSLNEPDAAQNASVSREVFAAIARQTRPYIPASSNDTIFGTTPAELAPEEFQTPIAPPALACGETSGTLITDTLSSPLLSRPLPVNIWLPPCHDPVHNKYPALYLMQGSGYTLGQWLVHGAPETAEQLINSGLVKPFIVVMPGNDMWIPGQGEYMWTQDGPNSWEGVITRYLVPMIEQRYGAQPDRESRAIGGISRGAYWSLEIGFSHPEMFSAVGGHSPATSKDILINEPIDFSMLKFAPSIAALKTERIWLDAGDTDWARAGMETLAKELKANGIPFIKSIGHGGHEDDLWTSRIYDYMTFYTRGWSTSPDRQSMPDTIYTGVGDGN
ncbi:MAG TPA: alpha/beta hydrolase-fold protein [Thermoflexales bacterium]|nr:alpha/beta hydrolase-fold protein [Thermoflexales bacterium]